jgi:TPP-dependent pyruvate/acetoin dehydrogenase alpha subunit
MGYRARAEVESWIANDELVRIKNMLPLKIVQQVEDRVTLMVLEAVNFAEEGKFPVESDLFSYVYHD